MKNGLISILFLFVGIVFAQAQQDTTYKAYLGRYVFSDGSVVPTVEVLGDSLKGLSMNSDQGSSPLEYQGGDRFNITYFNGVADFKRNDSTRQVIAIHIEAMGYILDGMKDKGTAAWTWKMYYTDEHIYAALKK